MTKAIEKAREIESLYETDKEGLFKIKEYEYDNMEQVVFLDLREGFSIYGYDGFGEQLEIERRKIPKEVKNLQSHFRAEGSATLDSF